MGSGSAAHSYRRAARCDTDTHITDDAWGVGVRVDGPPSRCKEEEYLVARTNNLDA